MNAQGLARLYDRLTVWERIPLLIAAHARGDDAEYRRLFDASPRRTWHLSEHLLDEQALHVSAFIYIGEQLEAAACYFFDLLKSLVPDDRCPEDWLIDAEACAYFFAANAEAWRRFCSDLGIASESLTAANHTGWFLRYCEETMPANAPTMEALQARFRERGYDVSQLVTAEKLLASWRRLLQAMTSHAPKEAGKGE
jgi:hypothetical protein